MCTDVENVFSAQSSLSRCDYETALHILDVALRVKQNDVAALYLKAVCFSNMKGMQEDYQLALNEVLLLDPSHTEARNRLVAFAAKNSSIRAFELLPEPSASEDSETRLYRAMVLTSVKRYSEALDVLAKLNGGVFDSHFDAVLCRAKAFRGAGEYAPAYLYATKAVELQATNEAALMVRASIVLEYWEWMRRRGLVTFGEDGVQKGHMHSRLVASVPSQIVMLSDSQNERLNMSNILAPSDVGTASSENLSSSRLSSSSALRSAALSHSLLMASKHQKMPSKLPPMNDLLSTALKDLNKLVDLRPSSIQARSKRAAIMHIMGVYAPAISDLQIVLRSELLQPAERPRLVLTFARLLFDAGEPLHLSMAHEILRGQLHISLDIDVLDADVAVLLVIGSVSELRATERIITSALTAISDHEHHALSPTSRGPLLLLQAKVNKRLSEIFELDESGTAGDAPPASTIVVLSNAHSSAQDKRKSLPCDRSTYATPLPGALEYDKCVDLATQAALLLNDAKILVRESAFWRQSGSSELALLFADQALQVDPTSLPAKLCKAAELYAAGDDSGVLTTLFGLGDSDPQVSLYRVLAGTNGDIDAQIAAINAYVTKLADSHDEWSAVRLDIRMRCWTTAQFHRALLLWRPGDREEARATLLEILKSVPTHPGALKHLAELLVIEGDLTRAIHYFELRLMQAYTRRLRIHLMMRIATCHHQLGEYGPCLEVISHVLQYDSNHQEALRLKADAERLNTRLGAALAYTRETAYALGHLWRKYWKSNASPPNASPPSSPDQDHNAPVLS